MDLDELRTVRRTEREKDSLQHLRDSFYEDVAAYLADLEARRDRAAAEADDPFASPEVRKLTDKIETAEEVSEAIYERRVGKIVKQASFAAADMTADRDGLTQQEADLFDDLVTRIKQNKTTVLDILAGEGDAADAAASRTDTSASTARSATAGTPTDGTTGEHPENAIPTGDDRSSQSGSAGDTLPPDAEPGEMLASAMGGENATEHETVSTTDEASSDGDAGDSAASNAARETNAPSATGEDRTAVEPAASPLGPLTGGTDASTGPTSDSPSAVNSASTADSVEHPESGTATDDASTTDRNQHGQTSATETDPRSDDDDDDGTPTTDGGAAQLQRTTVRITRDVGAILGVDEREYDLEREDVVTLPATNAEPLIKRDAAQRLE